MVRPISLATLLIAGAALANPRALPFTYPYETLAKDNLELEQYVDLTPVRSYDLTGTLTWTPRAILVTEIEYGLTDRLELGLYFQFSSDPGASSGEDALRFDGVKQRLRYRLMEQGDWPVDVSLYFEIAELRNEIEVELKLNLQRRFGPVRVMVNLWIEREFYFNGDQEWVLHPTAGVTVQLTPWLHLGLEYWMHAELGGPGEGTFNAAPHHFLGPAVMVQFKRLWWSVAPYVRLEGWGRAAQRGDQFGRVWVRSVIGIDL
jgi:hypothetical protein